MDDREFEIKKAELLNARVAQVLTSISIMIALAAAIVTGLAFIHVARLQTTQQLTTLQTTACTEVANVTSALYGAENQSEFDKAELALERVKHGDALLVLSPSVLNDLSLLVNNANDVKSDKAGQGFRNNVIDHVCNLPLKTVTDCRAELNGAFQDEAEGAVFAKLEGVKMAYTNCTEPR